MTIDPNNMLLIALVTLATFSLRAAGSVFMARAQLGPVATAAIEAMPVAVLTAVVAPAVFTQGIPELVAGVIALIVGLRAPMFAVIVTAMVCIVLMRNLIG